MFTGIIEEIGTIRSLCIQGSSGTIAIHAQKVLEGTMVGDSIAVNGICLTVTSIHPWGFTADVMAETIRRSALGHARTGTPVNLERAMAANGRFGGHLVSGHIDGTGIIQAFRREENAVWVTLSASPRLLQLVVEKGSITIDGISLTVAAVTQSDFQVSLIPHTGAQTTLLQKQIGDPVNLETDLVGKYVQKLLGIASATDTDSHPQSGLTMEYLSTLGY